MAKINFLGMEFNVVDQAMIEERLKKPDEPGVYIVSRVADLADAGDWGSPQLRARRTRTLCEGCGEVCWQDPKAYAEVAILKPEILCTHCMIRRLRETKQAGPRNSRS